jgi:gluconate 2-dehydrogenase gamma chain
MGAMRRAGLTGRLTRRQFTVGGALAGAVAVIGCRGGARGSWEFLSDAAGRTLAALCDQIIPADDFPSASQAGAVNYIDRQLARHYQRHQSAYRDGLEAADEMSRKRFGVAFGNANADQRLQIAVVLEKEKRVFFELVREHTMEGYYGSPRHGGNRDAVSWRMLGLDEPPLRGRAQYDLREGTGA